MLWTLKSRKYAYSKDFLSSCFKILFVINCCLALTASGARLKRAVMMNMGTNGVKCRTSSITESNHTSTIVLTATVKTCDTRKSPYFCEVEVWRIMKGKDLANNLTKVVQQGTTTMVNKQIMTTIYGLGNPLYCDSEVKKDNTRIFFLNRVNDRLVLSSSILRITLNNLVNTQKVIEGKLINEPPQKAKDPCLDVLCGFRATCQVTADDQPTCVCPDFECGKSNVFAPVCGSDGVTYASECRLRASQCWKQSRIRVASSKPCEPVTEDDPCKQIDCGNSASCVVSILDGRKIGRCECPTCDNVATRPVCGSDQTSHRSECDLRRTACLSGQDILLIRRQPCNPCQKFNEETGKFDLTCAGTCTLDINNQPVCCSTIPCNNTAEMVICGSDGKTYTSECAMNKQACRAGKSITKVKDEACLMKDTTIIRGSVSIAADDKCPGNCEPMSEEFKEFTTGFEDFVNKELKKRNDESIDVKQVLSDFKINEVRTGSSVLVYSATISTNPDPITEDYVPGSESLWAFVALHDPARGAVVKAAITFNVNFVDHRDPLDDYYAEDVCENKQCNYGSSCKLEKTSSNNVVSSCECGANGDPSKLPVTHACKRADNGRIYLNTADIHSKECSMEHYFTFKDLCREPPANPCDAHDCTLPGTTCVVTNGHASCECQTCEEDYTPVCGSNGQTYKNLCEMQRYNCLNGLNVSVKQQKACGSPCDTVDCGLKQCIETPDGSAVCICPDFCIEAPNPVCGNDGNDYVNECLMNVAACKQQKQITVDYYGQCGSQVSKGDDKDEMEGSGIFEGSGDADECGCRYGATCGESTFDDEELNCICNINCDAEPSNLVCGSNGITYNNECELRKDQCVKQRFISNKHAGKCQGGCNDSIYGCCQNGVTSSRGPLGAGCPENCGCNMYGSYAETCDPVKGQCTCKPGIGGLHCDRCEPGFWNFRAVVQSNAKGCMSCQCDPNGSVRDDCDQMTGHCVCKPGVTGPKCTVCIDNGNRPSKVGCSPDSASANSCASLNCQFNQDCSQNQDGKYSCECPSVESCTGSDMVCGTNGETYSNECLLRAITCKTGVDVQVESLGTCRDFVTKNEKIKEDNPPPITDETVVVPPLVEVLPEEETTTTTTTKPSTTTATTTVTTPIKMTPEPTHTTTLSSMSTKSITEGSSAMVEEGSGDDIMTNLLPPDDEDNYDSSGDDVPPTSTKTNEASTGDKVHLMGSVTFMAIGGGAEANSELEAELQSTMEDQILEILQHTPEISEFAEAVKIKELKMSNSDVIVKFYITLSEKCNEKCSHTNVQNKLNALMKGNWGSFTVTEAESTKGGANTGQVLYYESSKWPQVPQFGGSSYAEFKELENTNIAVTMEIDFRTFDPEGVLLYSGQTKHPAKDFISLAISNGRVEFRFDTGSGPLLLRSDRRVDDGMQHTITVRRNRKYGMLKVDDDAVISDSSQGSTHGVDLDSHLYIGGYPQSLADNVMQDVGVTKGLTGCISNIFIVPSKKNLNFSLFDTIPRNFYRLAECRQSPCNPNPCQNSGNCLITKQQQKFTYKCVCGDNYKGDNCEMISTDAGACSSSPCHESATCITSPNSQTGYGCICPPSRKGVNCEEVEHDSDLPLLNGASYMPGFAADSYIVHESLGLFAKHKLEIEIIIYTIQPDGLLLYNGQKKSGKGEFVSLNIRDGFVEFMYDLGDGPVTLRSASEISLNNWHVVKASRQGKDGSLTINNDEPIKKSSPGKSLQLNVEQPLYIGGVPDFSRVAPVASIITGLNGAIQKLSINDNTYNNLMDDAISSYNVRAFTGHVCYRQPCQNNGLCIPDLGGYKCHCASGFTGLICEHNKNGDVMLRDQDRDSAFFDGKTQVRYLNRISMSDLSVLDDEYELELKTTSDHGLILFVGQPENKGDYLALGIRHGRLHLRYDLGSGPAFIETDYVISDGRWKLIKLKREKYQAVLQVNDNQPMRLSAPPIATTLNSNGVLWLGGSTDLPTKHRGLPKSFFGKFRGCIGSVKIRKTMLHLHEDALDSVWLPKCSTRRK